MGKLDGKVALITGGSDGIGLATAQRFVAEGAYVFITGRRKEVLDSAVQKIGKKHVTAIQADASKLDQIDHVIQIIKKEKSKLDIIFANAAIADMLPLQLITEKHYDDTFNVNVKGVLFTVQKALPIFNDGGSIILNGSVVGYKGWPASSVYSATKAALRSFARTWTADLKERKIRVNVLSPGPVETTMFKNSMGGEGGKNLDAAVQQVKTLSPMARVGKPDEIATVAVFLASNDSSYITGIDLSADGGLAQV